MPQISSIPEVLYEPSYPYHYSYDNLPLKNILARINMVNIQVDTNTDIIRGSAGTAGSLNSRLDVSLNNDGTLKTSAIDVAMHSIASHEDTEEYVRMTVEERAKLDSITSDANKFYIEVEDAIPTVGTNVIVPNSNNGTLRLLNSSTIFFEFTCPNILKAHSVFPPGVAHVHHYDLSPAYDNPSGPSFQHYKTTSLNTPFQEGTLRVYLNGTRLSSVNIKAYDAATDSWINSKISSQSPEDGTFSLNRAISIDDVLRIDFDEAFLTCTPSAESVLCNSSSSSN